MQWPGDRSHYFFCVLKFFSFIAKHMLAVREINSLALGEKELSLD